MKKFLFKLLFLLILGVFLAGIGIVIVNYTNSATYEGTVTSHIKDEHRKNTYYFILDDDVRLKNSTLMFKNTSETVEMQEKIKVGQKVRADTVGIRIEWLGTYPIIYNLEVLE